MLATMCLCGCVLATAQSADRSEWLLVPRLSRAQELVYRGSFSEEAVGRGVQFNRSYRLETRVLVLDVPPQGADVALLTVLRLRANRPAGPGRAASADEDGGICSVRLELARVDLQGRVTPADPAVSLAVPLEGLPTIECGAFVEVPRSRVGPEQPWEVSEDGRPPRTWRVVGTEMVNGTSCLKLVGLQQSDDWDRPRADRTAWRRQDTVWVAPRLGIASRVERLLERREPARAEPTQRAVWRYELESSLQYPAQLFADRRREITQARAFAEAAAPLLPAPTRFVPQLEALLSKINHHLETQPPTPYRDAVLLVKRRVEAARRGESPPAPPSEPAAVMVAALGQPAPDFVAPDFTGRESARLRRFQGRPVLMIFYSPASPTTDELLQFAQIVHDRFHDQVAVVGLAMSDDAERVRRQHADLKLSFPILNGKGLRISYAVEATPRIMVLDDAGVVRGIYVGWGRETPEEVMAEVRRWLGK
ncbi:MAG TPA: redoxin domain-containing protein [Gemmataceae bacterium]|nr:redoxin domain-containing protein [Gemmataceae bacterium]